VTLVSTLSRLQVALTRAAASLLVPGTGERRRPPPLAEVRRIVVLRLDELGDVVLSTAFLRELRRAAPGAHITCVVQPAMADLLSCSPHVDEVLTHRTHCPAALRPFLLPLRAMMLGLRRLRPSRPELVVLPRWDGDHWYATFAARFSGAPHRVGYSEQATPHKRRVNAGYDALLTFVAHGPELAHEVERSLSLLRLLGAEPARDHLELAWSTAADRFAEAVLGPREGPDARRWVALSPSFGHSALKQWPPDRFLEVARTLLARGDLRLVLLGGPGDRALSHSIAEALAGGARDLTGRTTLPQLAAVLSRCALFIGADTGVLHMATAAGTPVIGVYGPTNVARFHPWRGQLASLDLLCSPVHRAPGEDRCRRCILGSPRCMLALPAEGVARSALAALDGGTVALSGRAQQR